MWYETKKDLLHYLSDYNRYFIAVYDCGRLIDAEESQIGNFDGTAIVTALKSTAANITSIDSSDKRVWTDTNEICVFED